MVEIMVAMAVLAILAVLVLKVSSAFVNSARIQKTKDTIRLVTEAVDAFQRSAGYLPLAVPYDAWGAAAVWTTFVNTMQWDGTGNYPDWEDYFVDSGGAPEFSWTASAYPTNIHMLVFQLEQVPESRSIIQQVKDTLSVEWQQSFDDGPSNDTETWTQQNTPCRLRHPLDTAPGTLRDVYQVQDAWGRPLRYWSSRITTWGSNQTWDPLATDYISTTLRRGNKAFFIESAGPNESFGWWGGVGSPFDDDRSADNITSVD